MNNGSVSRDEWQLFTQLPSNAQVDRLRESDVEKPHWVSDQVWKAKGLRVFIALLYSWHVLFCPLDGTLMDQQQKGTQPCCVIRNYLQFAQNFKR